MEKHEAEHWQACLADRGLRSSVVTLLFEEGFGLLFGYGIRVSLVKSSEQACLCNRALHELSLTKRRK